jgi:hypothetical protein
VIKGGFLVLGIALLAPLAAQDFGFDAAEPGAAEPAGPAGESPESFNAGPGDTAPGSSAESLNGGIDDSLDADRGAAASGDTASGDAGSGDTFGIDGPGDSDDAFAFGGDGGFGGADGSGFGFGGADSSGFGFGDSGGGDFGFGAGDSGGGGLGAALSHIKISGEVKAELLGFGDDFTSGVKLKSARWGDIFSGKLNFTAGGSNAEAVINLRLNTKFNNSFSFNNAASPISFDEAYLRAFYGSLTVEGGIRKLTWGKADSMGPLDVINPVDFSDFTSITDLLNQKIGRPMVHASYAFGPFTKLEGVFLPWFEGHRFASDGRWAPAQMARYQDAYTGDIKNAFDGALSRFPAASGLSSILLSALEQYGTIDTDSLYPDTDSLQYAQGGVRLTTTIGSSDIGLQYFTGNLFRPAVTIGSFDEFSRALDDILNGINQSPPDIPDEAALRDLFNKLDFEIAYNRYHQIGLDYAQVIGGFNLRSELAANITKDFSGNDGLVYNPAILWSLGFDRDLLWGINLNCQINESVRLMHHRVGADWRRDIEAGTEATSTRLTAILSRKFLRDELELNITGLWGIEDRDFFLIPALIWTKGDLVLRLSGGVFGGSRKGELGQYRDNYFVKLGLTYAF